MLFIIGLVLPPPTDGILPAIAGPWFAVIREGCGVLEVVNIDFGGNVAVFVPNGIACEAREHAWVS